jgi:hypothetical protein
MIVPLAPPLGNGKFAREDLTRGYGRENYGRSGRVG